MRATAYRPIRAAAIETLEQRQLSLCVPSTQCGPVPICFPDFYDFDLAAPSPAIYAAAVQAGYNGLGRTAGHGYKVEIDLAGTPMQPLSVIY